jgi:hypothetical protein
MSVCCGCTVCSAHVVRSAVIDWISWRGGWLICSLFWKSRVLDPNISCHWLNIVKWWVAHLLLILEVESSWSEYQLSLTEHLDVVGSSSAPYFGGRGFLIRISPSMSWDIFCFSSVDPLNAELNPTCHLLALLGAHHILHFSRVRVNPEKMPEYFPKLGH